MTTHDNTTKDADIEWDEGRLGQDEAHVRRSSVEREAQVEEATGLQMISVRLQKELIDQLKFIAEYRSIGYQPLMRDVLCRWARSEMLLIANEMKEQIQAQETIQANEQRKRA